MARGKLKENQIMVVIKRPGQEPYVEPLFPNELEAFQREVNGYIEELRVCSDLILLVNEEGRFNGLPYNCDVCGVGLFGTIIAVGQKGSEFASIKGTAVTTVLKMLGGR